MLIVVVCVINFAICVDKFIEVAKQLKQTELLVENIPKVSCFGITIWN
jgi:hypothetical protein